MCPYLCNRGKEPARCQPHALLAGEARVCRKNLEKDNGDFEESLAVFVSDSGVDNLLSFVLERAEEFIKGGGEVLGLKMDVEVLLRLVGKGLRWGKSD